MVAFMKADAQDTLGVAPPEYQEILDQIRDDHELIERLRITPEELEALSKCALLGTLTCKQDMLFILHQIRESGGPAAGGPAIDQTRIFPQPAIPEDQEEDPIPPAYRRRLVRLGRTAVAEEPGSLQGIARRRMPEQFGILFCIVVMVVGLAWYLLVAMSRWRNNFMTSVGMPAGHAAPSAVWFGNLDPSKILILGEGLLVVGIAVVVYLKSRTGHRRLKIRPGPSWR